MTMSKRCTATIRRARLTGLVAAMALLVTSGQSAARPRHLALGQADQAAEPLAPAQRDQLFPSQRGGGISLAQATQMAQSRYQGRVVRAEAVQMGERVVYEIRILGDDGRVRTVRIDAQTGSFL
jgi:uncharacterized membrane protein YkoI